jgi:hypothetical protein
MNFQTTPSPAARLNTRHPLLVALIPTLGRFAADYLRLNVTPKNAPLVCALSRTLAGGLLR